MLVAEGKQDQLAMRPRDASCLTCGVQNPRATEHARRSDQAASSSVEAAG